MMVEAKCSVFEDLDTPGDGLLSSALNSRKATAPLDGSNTCAYMRFLVKRRSESILQSGVDSTMAACKLHRDWIHTYIHTYIDLRV